MRSLAPKPTGDRSNLMTGCVDFLHGHRAIVKTRSFLISTLSLNGSS
ncbi:hypothetical protein [Leptolyngbya sp. FACHB-711]|nr:hypothetical protein [Leptolyngbya sp. FACHB-711]MBD1848996.1 hypothetical protein [Cyanobacteria bacterium FACHB-502]MBD2024989.1 hypothetical protein [Leptolyngbya sp. FACHB-711]